MPDLSNILICDMPLRFDTYKGCSHACSYCFVKRLTDIAQVKRKETAESLSNFIKKRRAGSPVYGIFDYDIPLHWGGLSDPFQPIEEKIKESYRCLQVFEATQYPFLVSTKGRIIAKPEYLEKIKNCNCAVQISAVCSQYDAFEPGAPPFSERLVMAEKIAQHKRVIVRIQPLVPEVAQNVKNNLKKLRDAGVYGVIVEFMKYRTKNPGLVKVQGDMAYPMSVISPIYSELKTEAHALGLKIFAGENRLRQYGDSLNCCGVGDLWKCHTQNLNHAIFDQVEFTTIHDIVGTIDNSFVVGINNRGKALKEHFSYRDILGFALKDKGKMSNYSLRKEDDSTIEKSIAACARIK